MITKKRIDYFDAVKGFAILSIVWGHVVNNPPFTSFGETYAKTWTSSFKLAVFYIVAGMLLSYSNKLEKEKFSVYAKKLFKGLIVPYISFNILLIPFYAIFFYANGIGQIGERTLRFIYMFVTMEGISTLWFLPTLFFGELLFYYIMKKHVIVRIVTLAAVIPVSFAVSDVLAQLKVEMGTKFLLVQAPALAISRSFVAFGFIAIGYYFYKYYMAHSHSAIIDLIAAVIMLAIVSKVCGLNKGVDFSMMRFGKVPELFFITGILGSLGIILLFRIINKYLPMKLLVWSGQDSLILMATHAAFRLMLIPSVILDRLVSVDNMYEFYFYSVIGTIILMLIELPIIILINKYGKWLIGKN